MKKRRILQTLRIALAAIALLAAPQSIAGQSKLPFHPKPLPAWQALGRNIATAKAPSLTNKVTKALSGQELWVGLAYEAYWTSTNQPIGIYAMDFGAEPSFSELHVDSVFEVNGGSGVQDHVMYTVYQDQRAAGLGILFTYITAYNTETWDTIYRMKPCGNDMWAQETAEDYATETVYGETFNDEFSSYALATFDYANQTRTVIGNLTQAYGALGFNPSDKMLYGISLNDGSLYKINPQTAEETAIGSTGLTLSDDEGGFYTQTGEITSDGTFYWAGIDINLNCAFYTVDLATGHVTKIADNPMYDLVTSMVQPMDYSFDSAPARVANLTVDFPETSLTGTVSFKAPTLTTDGRTLTGNIDYYIYQGATQLATGTVSPGADVSTQVTVATGGMTNLTVYCSNDAGHGDMAHIGVWTGYDEPDYVQEPTASIDNTKSSVHLTWKEPWRTLHYAYAGHYLYNIYRHEQKSDGSHTRVKVAENVDGLEYDDALTRDSLKEYTYDLVCVNGDRHSRIAQTNHVVGGTANEAPYFYRFPNTDATHTWVVRDDNGDGQQWEWLKIDGSFGAPYSDYGNDDWIISPPFYLRPGRTYTLRYRAEQNLPKDTTLMEVMMGQAKKYLSSEMTTRLTPLKEYTDTTPVHYAINFTVPKEGEYNFGFHDLSHAHLIGVALDSIQLDVEPVAEAPDSVTSLSVKPAADASLRTDISFRAPTKTLSGEPLESISKITIRRGHSLLHTFNNVTPGQELTFSDDSVENGWHKYYINAYNSADFGRTASDSVFVGADEPYAPTNLNITDNTTSVTLDWKAPSTTGVNGLRVNPDKIQYTIMNVDRNGMATDVEPVNVTGTTTCTIDVPNTNEGPAGHLYWEIYAHTTGGTSPALQGGLTVGAPYTVPFTESFANYNYEKLWWNSAISDAGWESNITPSYDAVDDDNGCAMAGSWNEGDQMWLHSGKISVKGVSNPHLYFYHRGSGVTFTVEVTRKNEDEATTIATFNDADAYGDWSLADVPLKDYVNDDYFYLAFKARINESGSTQYFDDINIVDAVDENLQPSFVSVPSSILRGQTATATLRIKNFGTKDASNYRVTVDNGKLCLDSVITEPLKPFLVNKFDVRIPSSTVGTTADSLKLSAKAIIGSTTASADTAIALLNGAGTPVENLTAQNNDGAVTLSWDAPADYEQPVTDDFESYDVGSTEFGPWTLIDANEGWACQLFENDSYWGQDQQFAYVIFNPSSMEDDMVEQYPFLAPHSGNQYAAVPYEQDSEGNFINGDNWIISPKLSGKEQTVDFYTHNVWFNSTDDNGVSTTKYMPEQYIVCYSTNDELNGTDGFKALTDTINIAQSSWKHEQIKLPEGTTYFAIHQVSDGAHNSLFGLDDVTYRIAGSAADHYNIYRDGELIDSVETLTVTDTAAGTADHVYQVTAVYPDGSESQPVSISVTANGIERIVVDESHPADVYTLGGQLVRHDATSLRGLPSGVYIVNGRKMLVK